jgi:hypothetical protein
MRIRMTPVVYTTVGLVIALFLLMSVAGCSQPFEASARDGIATASGFLNKAVELNKAECQGQPSEQKCQAIKKAAASLDLAIDGLEAYCGGTGFNAGTTPCQSPADPAQKGQLEAKLRAILQNLDRDITDVKKLTGIAQVVPATPAPPINRADMSGEAILAFIGFLLPLLRNLLSKAKAQSLPAEVVECIEGAVAKLEQVHGTPTMREQLESLRVDVPW